MTTKERLHKLVDELSEQEAARALEFVEHAHKDPLSRTIANAPEDDEPLTAEDEQAIAEGRADIAAGRLTSLEEIRREGEDKPGDIVDEWGNLSAMGRAAAGTMLQRLDEAEIAEFGKTIAEAWGYESPK